MKAKINEIDGKRVLVTVNISKGFQNKSLLQKIFLEG